MNRRMNGIESRDDEDYSERQTSPNSLLKVAQTKKKIKIIAPNASKDDATKSSENDIEASLQQSYIDKRNQLEEICRSRTNLIESETIKMIETTSPRGMSPRNGLSRKSSFKKDHRFYNDLSTKPLSIVALNYPKKFAKYWKSKVKEPLCTLKVPSEPEKIIDAAKNAGLFADVCANPQWTMMISVKEKPEIFKHMNVAVDNGEKTIIIAQSEGMGKSAVETANRRLEKMLEEKVAQLFLQSENLLATKSGNSSNKNSLRRDTERTMNDVFLEEELFPLGDSPLVTIKNCLNIPAISSLDSNPCIEVIIKDNETWILPRNYDKSETDETEQGCTPGDVVDSMKRSLRQMKYRIVNIVNVEIPALTSHVMEFGGVSLLQETFRRGNLQKMRTNLNEYDDDDDDDDDDDELEEETDDDDKKDETSSEGQTKDSADV